MDVGTDRQSICRVRFAPYNQDGHLVLVLEDVVPDHQAELTSNLHNKDKKQMDNAADVTGRTEGWTDQGCTVR